MKFSTFKAYIRQVLPFGRFIAAMTPTKMDDAAVEALEGIVKATEASAVDWSLVQSIIQAASPLIDELIKISFVPKFVREGWEIIKTILLSQGAAVSMSTFSPEE